MSNKESLLDIWRKQYEDKIKELEDEINHLSTAQVILDNELTTANYKISKAIEHIHYSRFEDVDTYDKWLDFLIELAGILNFGSDIN